MARCRWLEHFGNVFLWKHPSLRLGDLSFDTRRKDLWYYFSVSDYVDKTKPATWSQGAYLRTRRGNTKRVSVLDHHRVRKIKKGGDNLLSHWASPAVPSASRDLTSVFGMGTGVTLRLSSPPIKTVLEIHKYKEQLKDISKGRKSPKLEKEK